jgi:hypothetical protein
MKAVFTALEPLDHDARARVVSYVVSRLEIGITGQVAMAEIIEGQAAGTTPSEVAVKFSNFAELVAAASPKSTADKALLAGYWIQVCDGKPNFDGFAANTILKHLGEGLANITNAIDALKNQKPQLVLQLRKSGMTKQARKTYMVTAAGIKTVQNMISEDDDG